MPYSTDAPPEQIKELPKKAQSIWISTFNSTHVEGKDEDVSIKIAWGAVKNKYEQDENGKWRAKADTSLGDIAQTIRQALYARYPKEDSPWISDDRIFPGYVIFEKKGQWFKLTYSILDGKIIWGDKDIEVEQEWVEKRSQQEEPLEEKFCSDFRMLAEKDPDGAVWEVTICESGLTKRKDLGYQWYITPEALKAVAEDGLFENVDVNLFDLPSKKGTHLPDELFSIKEYLVKNKAGWLDNVRYVAGNIAKLVGHVHFLDSYKWLGKNLLDAKKKGQKVYGLSYDAFTNAIKTTMDNQPILKIIKFVKPDSLDIVTRPAAGGAFNRAVASRQEEEPFMNKEELWKLLEKQRPDLIARRTLAGMTDDEVKALFEEAMKLPQTQNTPPSSINQDPPQRSVQDQTILDRLNQIEKSEHLLRCKMALDNILHAADFPETVELIIKSRFENRIFEQTELDNAIKEQKLILAKAEEKWKQDNQPDAWVPGNTIRVGMGSYEKMTIAMDKMFGVSQQELKALRSEMCIGGAPKFQDSYLRSTQDIEAYDEIRSFESLPEAYIAFTGDREIRGIFIRKNLSAELRARADITSTSFTYALGNTLHRRIVATYRQADYGENLLISTKKRVKDFRTQEAILVGYYPDIETVDPETEDYQEIATTTDEEATYSIIQKGNILTCTRKMIINDDILLLQKHSERFGRSFRRTHAKYIWNKWINNSNCSDATAWHTSGHGNLGASALTISTFETAWIALSKMTEKDSGERICLLDDPNISVTLVHPPDLISIARTISDDDYYYTGADDRTTRRINPYKGRVTRRQLSLLTDVSDWGIFIPGQYIDHLEIGYLNGREEPEFFTADSPQSEQVFVADKIRYKGRHEYGGTPVDYRGSYKAEVTD